MIISFWLIITRDCVYLANYTIDYKHPFKQGAYSFSEIFALLFCYKHTSLTAITHMLEKQAKGNLLRLIQPIIRLITQSITHR